MTGDMPGEERSGEGPNCMASSRKDQGSDLHGQQSARGGEVTLSEVLAVPVFPVARYPELCALVPFHTCHTHCSYSALACLTAC